MSERKDRRGLGRGLSALMADLKTEGDGADKTRTPDFSVPVECLHPNPDQPRRHFAPEALQELAGSIRARGIIQPLVVRPQPGMPGHYQIVAGERRWRAAQLAQLHELPVLIRDFNDTEVLEVAIIENIQRADLNALDEALGYKQLMERFGHTQEKLAEGLGKSRSHIANLLRLLQLPDEVQHHLREGRLTAGHARTLVGHPLAATLAERIVSGGLSVRAAEALARKPEQTERRQRQRTRDADTRVIEDDLSASLGMSVVIDHRTGGEGRLTIQYKSLDQLDQLCQLLSALR